MDVDSCTYTVYALTTRVMCQCTYVQYSELQLLLKEIVTINLRGGFYQSELGEGDGPFTYLSSLCPSPPQAHLHPSEDEESDRRKYTSYRHEDLVEEIIYIKTFVQKFETVANESKAVAQRVSTGVHVHACVSACVRVCLCVCVCMCVLVCMLYMRVCA